MGQHTRPAQRRWEDRGVCRVLTSICPTQVVGVKDSVMGEEICACIRVRAGQSCTVEDIKAFCKGKVSLELLRAQLLRSLPDLHTQQQLGICKWFCKWSAAVSEQPVIQAPHSGRYSSARAAYAVPGGCVAAGFLFPDLPFQDPPVRRVCQSVPAHRLGQGKSWAAAGRKPRPPAVSAG